MTSVPKIKEHRPKGLTVTLVMGIVLAMGPLFGAIVSVFIMMHRTAVARRLVAEGLSDGVVQFPAMPVLVGFSLFPIGLLLVWFSVMHFSRSVMSHRKHDRQQG